MGILVGSLIVYAFRYDDMQGPNPSKYPLLARRIQVDNPIDPQIDFTDLRGKLTSYINGLDEDSAKVSVYFEYLPTGVSININEKNESIAASLMKLPVVMNLYKASELGKLDLDGKVAIKEEWLNQEYGTLYQKGAGYEITRREAARLALKDSDNTALLLVWSEINRSGLTLEDQSLNYLDVEYGLVEDERVQIGARSYSSILKCLYFACFNSKEDSQEMLEYLTQSTFNDRLTKYLPNEVPVAHKIGTFSTRYQSDCGITYVPSRNYILCIMVEGEDPTSSQYIADLSQLVYLYMGESQ